jgi:hypothetical protein
MRVISIYKYNGFIIAQLQFDCVNISDKPQRHKGTEIKIERKVLIAYLLSSLIALCASVPLWLTFEVEGRCGWQSLDANR